MKHLDIYRWAYKEPINRDIVAPSYWCTSRIGVVIGDRFIDTYWSWPPDGEYTEGRKWHLDKIEEKLELELIANLDDLELLTDIPDWYDDVIDLSHSNTRKNLKFVRKGQKRSVSAMIRDFQYNIECVERDIEYKTRDLQTWRDKLELLMKNGKFD